MTPAKDEAEPVLRAVGVSRRFGGVSALSDVTVDVWSRSITGLVGPNGAGKSTLFDVITGLRRPDSGRVLFAGRDVTLRSPEYRSRQGLARTFQHPQVFDSLTVREHLTLAYRVHRAPRRLWSDLLTFKGFRTSAGAEASNVDELLQLFGIAHVADAPVSVLPLGLTRLVEVGLALATGPTLLLLDEPSAGLNPEETRRLAVALETVFEERQVAILLVEHDLDLVLGLSSTVYVLDFGVLIACGTPEEIRRDEAVRAAYLGTVEEPVPGERHV